MLENYQVNLDKLEHQKTIILEKEVYEGLHGDMTILIDKDKGICISDVTCPNNTCKNQGWVKSVGYPVVCIPNGVYVIITSSSVNQDIVLG